MLKFFNILILLFLLEACSKKEIIKFEANIQPNSTSDSLYGTWGLADSLTTSNKQYYVFKKNSTELYYLNEQNNLHFLDQYEYSADAKQIFIFQQLYNYKIIEDTLLLISNNNKIDRYIKINSALVNEQNFVKRIEIIKSTNLSDLGISNSSTSLAVTKNNIFLSSYGYFTSFDKVTLNKLDTIQYDFRKNFKLYGVDDSNIMAIEYLSGFTNVYKTNNLRKMGNVFYFDDKYNFSSISYNPLLNYCNLYSIYKQKLYKTNNDFNLIEEVGQVNFYFNEILYYKNDVFLALYGNTIHTFKIINNVPHFIDSYILPSSKDYPYSYINSIGVYKDEVWINMSKYSISSQKYDSYIAQIKLN